MKMAAKRAATLFVALLGACSGDKPSAYQGYVEGEYVHVGSPVAGRLQKLAVQRGQTVEAKAPLFELEAEEEGAAKRQADEQLNAAQAQLADLKQGRRNPEVAVTQAQLAQAVAAEEQAALQLSDPGGVDQRLGPAGQHEVVPSRHQLMHLRRPRVARRLASSHDPRRAPGAHE